MARRRTDTTVAVPDDILAPRAPVTLPSRVDDIAYQHPRYRQYLSIWRDLGYVYEGDGPFLDGTALVPHPRELVYAQRSDGTTDYEDARLERPKYKRRKQLARYENFAASIVDTIIDHQFAKACARPNLPDEYASWIENVDGNGNGLDEWVRATQTLASVYGHVMVTMARPATTTKTAPVNRAQQGPFVLRRYLPEDMPDWLAPQGTLQWVKLVEAVERTSLFEPVYEAKTVTPAGSEDVGYGGAIQYRIVTPTEYGVYDESGRRTTGGAHGFPALPVIPYYCRRRSRIPVIGQALLRDPKLFKDHYNLVSELRELLRNQIFSFLNYILDVTETPQQAMETMGDHLSSDTVLFSRASVQYVQPGEGPAAVLSQEISNLERKIFRLIGLPWEGDSLDAESADSRRLKAMDLNRLLAGQAAEAQRFEYALAKLWYQGEYPTAWEEKFAAADITIRYAKEFYVEQALAKIQELQQTLTLGLGVTANTELRRRAVAILLPDLGQDLLNKIEAEIAKRAEEEEQQRQEFSELSVRGMEAMQGQGGQGEQAGAAGVGQPGEGGPGEEGVPLG